MGYSYALTFICTLLPCTLHSPLEPLPPVGPHPLPIPYNVSNSFVAVHSAANNMDHTHQHYEDSEGVFSGDDPTPLLGEEGEEEAHPLVRVKNGWLKGFTMRTIGNRSVHAFTGVPFALPPLGPLRFKVTFPPIFNF